jgi:hypothetical protein
LERIGDFAQTDRSPGRCLVDSGIRPRSNDISQGCSPQLQPRAGPGILPTLCQAHAGRRWGGLRLQSSAKICIRLAPLELVHSARHQYICPTSLDRHFSVFAKNPHFKSRLHAPLATLPLPTETKSCHCSLETSKRREHGRRHGASTRAQENRTTAFGRGSIRPHPLRSPVPMRTGQELEGLKMAGPSSAMPALTQ